MQCGSTSGELPAINLEHLKINDASRLNKVIAKLKALYQGNGQITITLNGGSIADIKPYKAVPTDE
jgi:hypothetical protein